MRISGWSSDVCSSGLEDIKPVIQGGSSDSAALDAVWELLCRGGRSAPMAKALLIPEAMTSSVLMPDSHKALISYCNAIMEPWEGPAALAATNRRWVLGGLDRNGHRPRR